MHCSRTCTCGRKFYSREACQGYPGCISVVIRLGKWPIVSECVFRFHVYISGLGKMYIGWQIPLPIKSIASGWLWPEFLPNNFLVSTGCPPLLYQLNREQIQWDLPWVETWDMAMSLPCNFINTMCVFWNARIVTLILSLFALFLDQHTKLLFHELNPFEQPSSYTVRIQVTSCSGFLPFDLFKLDFLFSPCQQPTWNLQSEY